MRSKPYTEIRSLSRNFVDQVAAEYGTPDNFVDSADATFAELPNVDSDPGARAIIGRLEERRDDLIAEVAERRNGNSGTSK
jgi:hypothetical protein